MTDEINGDTSSKTTTAETGNSSDRSKSVKPQYACHLCGAEMLKPKKSKYKLTCPSCVDKRTRPRRASDFDTLAERNDPCPCGATKEVEVKENIAGVTVVSKRTVRKKYKHCCYPNIQDASVLKTNRELW